MKKRICLGITVSLLWYLPVLAQVGFSNKANWNEILKEARAEHKGIFVDFYATWCVPCKWMDANVYADKQVAEVFNQNFICLRLQIDRTASDNEWIKSWYRQADQFAHTYNITAYPTFLFFDEDGKPLHKATGSMDKKAFIKMASDARNPDRQYYTIIKNFTLGKIDTAEERALAYTFRSTDKALSGKMAADYLSRISDRDILKPLNQDVLWQFQDAPEVRLVVDHYLGRHSQSPNLDMLVNLKKLPQVQEVARNYINDLPEDSLCTTKNIRFMGDFTTTISDRGFFVFRDHSSKVDEIMKQKWYAQNHEVSVIFKQLVTPTLENAKKINIPPDFETIHRTLVPYGEEVAYRVMIDAKLEWYKYEVNVKKDTTFLQPMIDEQLRHVTADHWDLSGTAADVVNNICYLLLLPNNCTRAQLDTGISWMKQVAAAHDNDYDYFDTYASLLFKSGRKKEAIEIETNALAGVQKQKNTRLAKEFQTKIDRMMRDEKIWLDK